MRDRWVLVFVLFCFAQLPYYVWSGRGPLGYDTSIKFAEQRLAKAPQTPAEIVAIRKSLDDADKSLAITGLDDSRRARLDMTRALLAWNDGRLAEADGAFRQSVAEYESKHGRDAFHTEAVSLRYGEFLMLTRRSAEALPYLEIGTKAVEETLGPSDPFAVRMTFRRVDLLTSLGRKEEARALAQAYLPRLIQDAGRFDEVFLSVTAGVLDVLTQQQGLPLPPGATGGWRRFLDQAHKDGRARLDDIPGEG